LKTGKRYWEAPSPPVTGLAAGFRTNLRPQRVHKMLVLSTTYIPKLSKLLKLWKFGPPVVEVLILLVVVVFCCDTAGTTTVQFCTLTPVQRVTRRGRYLAYSTSRPASPPLCLVVDTEA